MPLNASDLRMWIAFLGKSWDSIEGWYQVAMMNNSKDNENSNFGAQAH